MKRMPERRADNRAFKTSTPEELFWDRVRCEPSGCWTWTGTHDRDGYGLLMADGHYQRAHRFAYALLRGDVPPGLVAIHACDNRGCVNPDHISFGTHAENIADKVAKGRQAVGERMAAAKLTEQAVRDIRAAHAAGISQKTLARQYGVHDRAISFVVKGITWRHVR